MFLSRTRALTAVLAAAALASFAATGPVDDLTTEQEEPTTEASEPEASASEPESSESESSDTEQSARDAGDTVIEHLNRVLDLEPLFLDDLGLGRLIVRYEDGTDLASKVGELADLGVARAIEIRSAGVVAVTADPTVLLGLLSDTDVTDYYQQRKIALDLYASREQIKAENAEQPMDYTLADQARTRPGVTGAGVTVGILDSGVNSLHPDTANTTTGLHFGFAGLAEIIPVTTEQLDQYAEGTGFLALQDEIGHGTHVASTVGGTGQLAADTGGPDLSGVAPGVEFVSLKITTAPFGIVEDFDFEESALAAFDYILRHPDLSIDVTNNSWGLLPTEPNCLGLEECFGLGEATDFDAVSALVDQVVDSGVDVVFSAGNDGPADEAGIGTIGYHVGTKSIIVAAACKSVDSGCDEGEDTTGFSSRGNTDRSGPQVEVTAPGDQIMAALSPSILAPLTECADAQHPGYYCISGTSMSSPHVAGVAALLREVNPDITPAQLEQCIIDTAVPMANALELSDAQLLQDVGAGLVHTEDALICAHSLITIASVDTPAAAPDPVLATTGGGAAFLSLALLTGAMATRRRREA